VTGPHDTGPPAKSAANDQQYPVTGTRNQTASHTTLARRIIRLRRRREILLGNALFADPAWDMLLDLLVAEEEDRAISVTSLCIAAAVPVTTAQRWITVLAEGGLITRKPHPHDRRTVLIRLVPETSSRLRLLLGEF
jgi:DNA-binding MarR family transcriptional regulator